MLCVSPLVTSAQLQLLKDLEATEEQGINEYSWLTNAGRYMYFVSNGELWKSNGTTKWTVRMKAFESISNLTMSGQTLYFAANDGETGTELWKSNGTPASTVKVKDIMPGEDGSSPTHLTDVNGTLYFAATTEDKGTELWRSDGTAGGTVMVKDISRRNANPRHLVNFNGTLFFVATSPAGHELWRSDGTSGNTKLVKDIIAGSQGSNPAWLTVSNGNLFFVALHPQAGRELWISDGTTSGTRLLKDILPGSKSSRMENLIHANGKLMFTAHDGIHGDELWASNGTAMGTSLVKDMNPGPAGSNTTDAFHAPMGHFTSINGMLYFIASKGANDYIYRSDGTEEGTVIITQAFAGGMTKLQPEFTYRNGYVLFFNASPYSSETYSLYKMPYKGKMMTRIADLQIAWTVDNFTFDHEMILLNGSVYFPGRLVYDYESYGGYQLIRSTGTPEGTVAIYDAFSATMSSRLDDMITVGSKTYVLHYSFLSYYGGLTSTDGTPEGTFQIREEDGYFFEWEAVGDDLYYSEETRHYSEDMQQDPHRWQLSKTRGTPETTTVIAFGEGWEEPARPRGLTNVNGTLYYFNDLGELWKTNGTPQGTVMVAKTHNITWITNVGGQLFVFTVTSDDRLILWKMTTHGLTHVTTLFTTTLSGNVTGVHALSSGGILYFLADQHDGKGFQIWRSDGTGAGTYRMFGAEGFPGGFQDIYWNAKVLIDYNDELYFSNGEAIYHASDNVYTKVANMPSLAKYVEFNNKLFLITSGDELQLYVTDGTSAGTTSLHWREVEYEWYVDYAIVGDYLYFNTLESPELWRTDGTPCGTSLVDVGAGTPYALEGNGDDLIFGGYKLETGQELYVYHNVNSIPGTPCEEATTFMATHANEVNQQEMLTAYPNPFAQSFMLNIGGKRDEKVSVAVFTIGGMPVERHDAIAADTGPIQLGAGWPEGHYIIKVQMANDVNTYHVLKE